MSAIILLILATLFLIAFNLAAFAVSCLILAFKVGFVAVLAFGSWKALKALLRS